jgi:hypothetical protein
MGGDDDRDIGVGMLCHPTLNFQPATSARIAIFGIEAEICHLVGESQHLGGFCGAHTYQPTPASSKEIFKQSKVNGGRNHVSTTAVDMDNDQWF